MRKKQSVKCSVVTYRFATSSKLLKIIRCNCQTDCYYQHSRCSVKCSVASDAITEGQAGCTNSEVFESDNDAEDAPIQGFTRPSVVKIAFCSI